MRLYAKVDRHNAVKLIAHAPASKWNGGPVSSRGRLEAAACGAALTAGHLPGEQRSLRRYMGGPVRFANGGRRRQVGGHAHQWSVLAPKVDYRAPAGAGGVPGSPPTPGDGPGAFWWGLV